MSGTSPSHTNPRVKMEVSDGSAVPLHRASRRDVLVASAAAGLAAASVTAGTASRAMAQNAGEPSSPSSTPSPTDAAATFATERRGSTIVMTLESPRPVNAMSMADWRLFEDAVRALLEDVAAADEPPRAVVLHGAKGEFGTVLQGEELIALDHRGGHDFSELGHRVHNMIEDAPVPFIAAVEGTAVGSGLELAMACDMIVAAEDATFIQTETMAGLPPGFGGTWRLPRRVGRERARLMTYTAMAIDGRRAAEWGLALEAVPSGTALARSLEIAGEIARTSAQAVRHAKELLNISESQPRAVSNAAEQRAFGDVISTDEMRAQMQSLMDNPRW